MKSGITHTFSFARPACFCTDLASSELLLSAIFTWGITGAGWIGYAAWYVWFDDATHWFAGFGGWAENTPDLRMIGQLAAIAQKTDDDDWLECAHVLAEPAQNLRRTDGPDGPDGRTQTHSFSLTQTHQHTWTPHLTRRANKHIHTQHANVGGGGRCCLCCLPLRRRRLRRVLLAAVASSHEILCTRTKYTRRIARARVVGYTNERRRRRKVVVAARRRDRV